MAWERHRKRVVFFPKPLVGDFILFYFIPSTYFINLKKKKNKKHLNIGVFPLLSPDLFWHKVIRKTNSALQSTEKVYDALYRPRDTHKL